MPSKSTWSRIMSVLKDNQLLKPKQTGCETLKQTGCETLKQTGCETLKQTGCETLTSGPHHTSVVTSFCQIFLLSDIVMSFLFKSRSIIYGSLQIGQIGRSIFLLWTD